MKIRFLVLGWLIYISSTCCMPVQLKAVPYSEMKQEQSVFDFSQISCKEMEKKLGRKMKWKERFAFRWMKKKDGILKTWKVFLMLILITLLILTLVFIRIELFFAQRDGEDIHATPYLLAALNIGLIYFLALTPTKEKQKIKEEKTKKIFD